MQGENKNIHDDGMSLNTMTRASYSSSTSKVPYSDNVNKSASQKNQQVSTTSNTDNDSDKAGLFDGISKAQVLAGALASVTSMLLSSKIGIAGSVIGVAVGSVVSTVASTVYKNILNNSANALKNASVFGGSEHDGADAAYIGSDEYSGHALDKTIIDNPLKSYLDSQDGTASTPTGSFDENVIDNGNALRIAPDELIKKNAERHKRQLRNRLIIFSIVVSLIAVAVTAILISAFTGGEGIGQKTDPIIIPSSSVSVNKTDSDDDAVIAKTPSNKHLDSDSTSAMVDDKKVLDGKQQKTQDSVDNDSTTDTAGKTNESNAPSSSDKSDTEKWNTTSNGGTGNTNTENSGNSSNANSSKPNGNNFSSNGGNQSGSDGTQPPTPSNGGNPSTDSSGTTSNRSETASE